MDRAKNFAKATVFDGNYDASATEIDVLTGEGARFPATPFNAVWWNATDYPDPADDPDKEIVRVTDITDDTLTITRAQEGTSADDKNVAGKTYKLMAGLTAKTLNEEILGDVHGSGMAIRIDLENSIIRLHQNSNTFLTVTEGTTEVQDINPIYIGDAEGNGNSGYLFINDATGKMVLNNLDFGSSKAESASTSVGTLVAKLAIYDQGGDLIGYIPIYGSIT